MDNRVYGGLNGEGNETRNMNPGLTGYAEYTPQQLFEAVLDVYIWLPQVSDMSQRTSAPNPPSTHHDGDMLYGRPLPANDSAEAIERDMTSIEQRLDALIAKVSRVLSR